MVNFNPDIKAIEPLTMRGIRREKELSDRDLWEKNGRAFVLELEEFKPELGEADTPRGIATHATYTLALNMILGKMPYDITDRDISNKNNIGVILPLDQLLSQESLKYLENQGASLDTVNRAIASLVNHIEQSLIKAELTGALDDNATELMRRRFHTVLSACLHKHSREHYRYPNTVYALRSKIEPIESPDRKRG